MIDAVTFDISGATSQTFTIPDASGLAPLKVPVGWPNHSHHFDDELPQPSPDAIARFQAAMAEPAAAAPAAPKPTTDKHVTLPASDKHVTLPTTDKQVIGKQVAGEIVEQPVGSRVPRDRVPTEFTDIPGGSGRAGRTDSTNDSGRAGRASLPDGLVRTERVDIPSGLVRTERVDIPSGTPAIHSQPDGIRQDRRQTTDDKQVTLPTSDTQVVGKQVVGEIVEQPVGSRVPRDRVPTERTDIPSDSGRAGRTDSTNDSGRAGRASLPDGLVRTERVDIPSGLVRTERVDIPSGTPAIHSQPDGIEQDRRLTTDDKQATLPPSDRQAVGKQVAGEIVEQPVGSRVPRDRVPTERTDIPSDSGRAGRASLPEGQVRVERTDIPSGLVRAERVDIPRNTPTIHSLPDGIEQDRRLTTDDRQATLPTSDRQAVGKQVAGEIVEQPVGSRVPRDRVPTERTDIPSDSGRAERTDMPSDSGRAGRASLPDGQVRAERTDIPIDRVRAERVDIPSNTPAIHSLPDGIGQDRRPTTDDKQVTLPTSDTQVVGKQVVDEIVEQPVGSRVPRDRVPTERTDIPSSTPAIQSLPDGVGQDRRLTTDDRQVTLPTSDRQAVGKQVVGEIVEQPVGSRVPRDRVPTEHTDIPSDSGRAGRASLPDGQVRAERTDIPSGLVRAERVDIPSGTPTIHSLPDGIEQDRRPTTDDKQVTLPTSDRQVAGKQVVGEIVEQPVGSRVPRDRVPTERTDIPSDSGRAGRASLPDGQVRAERTDIPIDRVRAERTDIPSDHVRTERTNIPRDRVRTERNDIPMMQPTDDIPTLQAAPVSAPVAPDVAPAAIADAIAIEIDPAAATAKTRELVEAASQVADTILVTPSLVRGDGEITIRLKPTVLDGSEIRMEAKGSSISIHIVPATPSVAQTIEQAKAQFEQTLAERLPSFQIAVSVENLKTSTRKRQTA